MCGACVVRSSARRRERGGGGAGARYTRVRAAPFSRRYEQGPRRESSPGLGLREAANQQADAAEGRFAHLAAALTMLVVAVFLFGYSLAPQGRERRALFSSVATAFALAGIGWAIFHGLRGGGARRGWGGVGLPTAGARWTAGA